MTVRLDNSYSSWHRGAPAHGRPFVASIALRYPEQDVVYRPGFWQVGPATNLP